MRAGQDVLPHAAQALGEGLAPPRGVEVAVEEALVDLVVGLGEEGLWMGGGGVHGRLIGWVGGWVGRWVGDEKGRVQAAVRRLYGGPPSFLLSFLPSFLPPPHTCASTHCSRCWGGPGGGGGSWDRQASSHSGRTRMPRPSSAACTAAAAAAAAMSGCGSGWPVVGRSPIHVQARRGGPKLRRRRRRTRATAMAASAAVASPCLSLVVVPCMRSERGQKKEDCGMIIMLLRGEDDDERSREAITDGKKRSYCIFDVPLL